MPWGAVVLTRGRSFFYEGVNDFPHAGFVTFPKSHRTPSAAEPNIVVRVRRAVVQIGIEHAGIRAIVPVASPDDSARPNKRLEGALDRCPNLFSCF